MPMPRWLLLSYIPAAILLWEGWRLGSAATTPQAVWMACVFVILGMVLVLSTSLTALLLKVSALENKAERWLEKQQGKK